MANDRVRCKYLMSLRSDERRLAVAAARYAPRASLMRWWGLGPDSQACWCGSGCDLQFDPLLAPGTPIASRQMLTQQQIIYGRHRAAVRAQPHGSHARD